MIFHKFRENRITWINPKTYKAPTLTVGRNQDLQYQTQYFGKARYSPLKVRCKGIIYGGCISK